MQSELRSHPPSGGDGVQHQINCDARCRRMALRHIRDNGSTSLIRHEGIKLTVIQTDPYPRDDRLDTKRADFGISKKTYGCPHLNLTEELTSMGMTMP